MEAFDNSNGAKLDNLNQDIFQKSNALTGDDLDMDIKNTNITSPSLDNLNNIQSYTIDNQKTSEIIDQNRISHGDFIFDENNEHSQVRNIAPFETNGKKTEFIATDNYFGPESNVDDDTIGVGEFNTKNENFDENISRPDDAVAPHGIHFEDIDFLKTVDEGEECDTKKDVDVDVDVADHRQYSFDSEDLKSEQNTLSAEISSDLLMDSVKILSADCGLPTVVPEKIEDPIDDPTIAENVIVPESGEESEDEWKYIEVKKASNENETQERIINSQETVESQNICPDLVNDNQSQDDEIVRIEELSLSEADMASQLNPDAKEFIPTTPSPTNTTPSNSLEINGLSTAMATLNLNFEDDLMLSQSPRKGTEGVMGNIAVPEENDFLNEISKRPAELDAKQELRPGSSSSQCSYQEMNLKEAMHGDEKQEYAPDVLTSPDQGIDEGNLSNGDHEQFINILNKSMRNQDLMTDSVYIDGSGESVNPFDVDLNAVHRLPTSDEENEDDQQSPVFQSDVSGRTYAIEDTEFGMSDFIQMDRSEMLNGANNKTELIDRVSTVEENAVDTIVGAVQEMISENMAVLNECDLLGNDSVPKAEEDPLPIATNDSLATGNDSLVATVIDSLATAVNDSLATTVIDSLATTVNDSVPAVNDSVTVVDDSVTAVNDSDTAVNDSLATTLNDSVAAVSESLATAVNDSLATALNDSSATTVNDSVAAVNDSLATAVNDSVAAVNDSFAPSVNDSFAAAVDDSFAAAVNDSLATAVADSLAAAVADSLATAVDDSLARARNDEFENHALPTDSNNVHALDVELLHTEEQSSTAVTSESIVENKFQNDIVAAEPVVEAAVKSVVAAVADVVAKPKSSAKATEPKSKSASLTTKKLSTVTTAKPKVKPISQLDATAAKTAPIPRPRTVASQPPVKTIEKKSSSTAAPKKPVNGDIVKTTTTISAAKRPASSTTTVKTNTSARTASSTLTTTTTKVTSTRLITKTSTATVPDATKRAPISKPSTTTSLTQRARPSSEKTTSLNSKSPISKVATSVTEKLTKDSTNKPQTASRAPISSPRTASATSQRPGTLTAKKSDTAKIPSAPSAPAPIKRPTNPSSSIQEKRPPVANATSKVQPSQKRPIPGVNKNRATVDVAKKPSSPLKKITKPQTTAVTEESKPQENGNQINGTELHALNDEINDVSSASVDIAVNNEQEPVIM